MQEGSYRPDNSSHTPQAPPPHTHICCMTSDQFLGIREPQLAHLGGEDNILTYQVAVGTTWRMGTRAWTEHPPRPPDHTLIHTHMTAASGGRHTMGVGEWGPQLRAAIVNLPGECWSDAPPPALQSYKELLLLSFA